MSVDHRDIQPGGLFAALPGHQSHGAWFSDAAARAGAVAVLTDAVGADLIPSDGLPVIVFRDPRRELGSVAARVYGTDLRRPQTFGVTGTNGKTTTVHLLEAILRQSGVNAGHSSTASRESGESVVVSRLTTPEAPELHALLARMIEDGVTAAAVEVSAQALTHHRTGGIVFDVAGFTNLSHDHLDDYTSMGSYLAAKVALFKPDQARAGVVSLDSPAGGEVKERARIPVVTVSSTPGVPADWAVDVTKVTPTHTSFRLQGPTARQTLATRVPLIGRHMAADCGLALLMLMAAGYDLDLLRDATSEGVNVEVPGRTALVSGTDGPRVYVDFSHTPGSIEKTLTALRDVAAGPVIVLLGADGGRDRSKREPMGAAAAIGADVVIVTDHHSRDEDPASIRRALITGARNAAGTANIRDVADSNDAIRQAIQLANNTGTILWVGPGNVDYRIISRTNVPYSPRFAAARALVEAGWQPSPLLASAPPA